MSGGAPVHELSIAQALVRAIAGIERPAASTITAVHLRLGALTSVEPESLRFAFAVASQRSAAAGSQLTIERVPLRGRCRQCGWQGEPSEELGCPRCAAVGLEVVSGRELELVGIEVEP